MVLGTSGRRGAGPCRAVRVQPKLVAAVIASGTREGSVVGGRGDGPIPDHARPSDTASYIEVVFLGPAPPSSLPTCRRPRNNGLHRRPEEPEVIQGPARPATGARPCVAAPVRAVRHACRTVISGRWRVGGPAVGRCAASTRRGPGAQVHRRRLPAGGRPPPVSSCWGNSNEQLFGARMLIRVRRSATGAILAPTGNADSNVKRKQDGSRKPTLGPVPTNLRAAKARRTARPSGLYPRRGPGVRSTTCRRPSSAGLVSTMRPGSARPAGPGGQMADEPPAGMVARQRSVNAASLPVRPRIPASTALARCRPGVFIPRGHAPFQSQPRRSTPFQPGR